MKDESGERVEGEMGECNSRMSEEGVGREMAWCSSKLASWRMLAFKGRSKRGVYVFLCLLILDASRDLCPHGHKNAIRHTLQKKYVEYAESFSLAAICLERRAVNVNDRL